MASIANLPEIERHVSALKTITEVINDIQEELDDSSDIKGQTLLQLRQIRLSICEKLKVLTGNPEPTIAAPSAEDLHPPENASSSLTQIARPPTSGSDFDSHEAYRSSDQMGEAGPSFAGERRVSGPVQQLIPRQSRSLHQFGGHEAVRIQPPAYEFGVAADIFPYVKAPFNTKYNTVCPHSLIAKTCKGKCSLRKAYLRTHEEWDQCEETLQTCGVILKFGNCRKHEQGMCLRGHDHVEERKLMQDGKVLKFHKRFNM